MKYDSYIDQHCEADIWTTISMDADGLADKAMELEKQLVTALEKQGADKSGFSVKVELDEVETSDPEDAYATFMVKMEYDESVGYTEGSKSHDWYQPDDPPEVEEIDAANDMMDMISTALEELGIPAESIDFDISEDRSDTAERLFDKADGAKQDAYEAHMEALADARREAMALGDDY